MKPICVFAVLWLSATPLFTQEPVAVGVLEERLNRLRAEVEDLQFRQQKIEKQLDAILAELKELRRNAGAVSSEDLKALEAKIAAVDAARQKDNKAIVDELARQLAALAGGGKPSKASSGASADKNEHIVQKGETLSSIARTYGVSVAALKKANNLTSDSLAVGQKLVVPK